MGFFVADGRQGRREAILLDIISRWLHVLAAAIAVGSFIYGRWVLTPALQVLGEEQRRALLERLAAHLRPLAVTTIVALLVTGFYNLYRVLQGGVEAGYHMVFGIKFLLALHVVGMLFLLSAPPSGDPARDAKRPRWMLGAAVSGVIVLALGAYLRTLHR